MSLENAGEATPLAPSPLRVPEFRNMLAISFVVALGFGLVIPVLPNFALELGASVAAVGLTQALFGVTRFGFGVVGGVVVDRFGERACTMAGLLIVAGSSYMVGFAQSFGQLVIARGLGGAGSALFIAGLMNRVLRIIEPAAMGRATGIFRSSFLVGIAAGPGLGGVLAEAFGDRSVFHVYATGLLLATVIAFVVMAKAAREAAATKKSPLEALRAARPLFSDVRYRVALLATFVTWWTLSGPAQTVASIYGKRVLGFSKQTVGIGITLLAIGEILALLVAGRAADRYGRRTVLVPALGIAAVSTFALGQVQPAPWTFFVVIMILGAAISAAGAASGGLLADAIPRGGSGAAVGVNQMAGDAGFVLSQVIVAAVAGWTSFSTAYAIAAIPAGIVFFSALRLPRQTTPTRDESPAEPHEPVG